MLLEGKRFYIGVDCEGAACVVGEPGTGLGRGEQYQFARKQAAREANAAAQELFELGAEEVIVWDNHGTGCNFDYEQLDPRVKIAKKVECDDRPYSLTVKVPALGICIYSYTKTVEKAVDNKTARGKRKNTSAKKTGLKEEISRQMELAQKAEEQTKKGKAEEPKVEEPKQRVVKEEAEEPKQRAAKTGKTKPENEKPEPQKRAETDTAGVGKKRGPAGEKG